MRSKPSFLSIRSRREIHERYLNDVVYEVSTSRLWRERLFNSKEGEKFLIDRHSPATEPILVSLHQILDRYNLKYYVSKVSKEDGPNWDWVLSDEGIYFKFEAKDFPGLYDFSYNNPDSK